MQGFVDVHFQDNIVFISNIYWWIWLMQRTIWFNQKKSNVPIFVFAVVRESITKL